MTAGVNFGSVVIDMDPGDGTSALINRGGADAFMATYSAAGDFVWGVHFASPASNIVNRLVVDGAGNRIVIGRFEGTLDIGRPGTVPVTLQASGGPEGFLAKIDSAGDVVWARTLGEGGSRRTAAWRRHNSSGPEP